MNRFLIASTVALVFFPSLVLAQASDTLSLSQAITEADARNPEILAAQQAIEIDRARLTQVARQPLQLQGGPSIGVDVPGGVGRLETLSAGAAQQFPAGGSLSAARSAASAGIGISTAQLQFTRRDVERRVINAYYTLASMQAQRRAAQQNVTTTHDLLRSAELRKRAGAVGQFEVLRANVELRRAQTDLLRGRAAQRTAAIVLNTLIGRFGSTSVETVQLKTVSISERDEQALFTRAVAIDPTVAQLNAALDQAQARVRLAQSQRAPSFSANVGFQVQRAPMNGMTSRGPTAGIAFSLPIVDYGTIKGAVREFQAAGALAQAQLNSRNVQIRSDIAQAVADVQSSGARQSFAAASLQQAQRSLQIAQFGYRQGALGTLDVLAARNALSNARADADQAAADLGAAAARLQLLVGGPLRQ